MNGSAGLLETAIGCPFDGPQRLRAFHLVRLQDKSGVSGTGNVAEGVVFSNGWVALCWLSERPSVALYSSIDDVDAIHGHEGNTRIVWCGEASTDRAPNPPAGDKPDEVDAQAH
jgi:hypothetical protein